MRRRFQKNLENLLEIKESEKMREKPKFTIAPPSFYRKNSEKRWNKHLKRKFTFLFASKVHGQPRLEGFFGFFSGFFQETSQISTQTQFVQKPLGHIENVRRFTVFSLFSSFRPKTQ